MVAAHAGALPLGPPGRGAAGVPGPAVHPGGRAGDRSRARRRPGWSTPSSPRSPPSTSPSRPSRGAEPGATAPAATSVARATSVRVPASPNEGPLVGRDRESALLRDWWASVGEGDGRLLLVDGEPGIGKTRLVAELARAVEEDGVLVLWGRCDEDPVAPFQPFAEALGRYFQSLSADRISQHAELAAHGALPARPAPARVRTDCSRRSPATPRASGSASSRRSRPRCNELSSAARSCWSSTTCTGPTSRRCCCCATCCGASTRQARDRRRCTSTRRCRPITGCAPCWPTSGPSHPVETVHLRGPERRRGGGAGARLAERRRRTSSPQLCRLTDGNPLFLDEMLRQLRLPRGRAGRRRRRARAAQPQPDPRPSASSWRGASPGCPRT